MSDDVPSPGSPEARDKGGTCPAIDNRHGEGSYKGGYIIRADCPLHGVREKDSSSQTE